MATLGVVQHRLGVGACRRQPTAAPAPWSAQPARSPTP